VAGGRIVAVGEIGAAAGAEEIDLDGLALAPGFIDIHTHYDAQVMWDPDLTPSCWHGVTTVVMGNCGFGVAPTKAEHRELILRTLENVEGMSLEALTQGVDWSFETFAEYLDVVRSQPLRLNVGALIGHTPLRLSVMGEAATEREATTEEITEMRAVVADAVNAGAVGFASSAAPTHAGAYGKPVPSRFATFEEYLGVAMGLADAGRGVMQATAGATLFIDQFAEISEATGRPVSWTALLTGMFGKGAALRAVDATEEAGGEVWPQVSCRPLVMQLTLADPFALSMVEGFDEVLAAERPERAAFYRDPAWRDRARPHVNKFWGDRLTNATVQETELHPELRGGPTLGALAAERGADPFDVLCDLALEEDLGTRFRVVLANDDDEEIGQLLQDRRTVLGLSDAGAHASQLCDANFSTFLLAEWTRKRGILSLEDAVWRLTDSVARAFRLDGRGRIAEGYAADLVAFDPDTVDTTELERVHDLPGGADRLIARSVGIEHMWVNGVAVRRHGADLDLDGTAPGTVMEAGTLDPGA
jgi:N-acyl-D-aspartate/D-glutamate deacylase